MVDDFCLHLSAEAEIDDAYRISCAALLAAASFLTGAIAGDEVVSGPLIRR